MSLPPLAVVGAGILVLLVLILRFRVHAILALLAVSLGVGLVSGLAPPQVIRSVTEGMGGTLGFIAVVVGVGAMFAAILETGGGIAAIARGLLKGFGEKRSGMALGFIGLLVSIPVFFDVALIILIPLVFGLARRTGRTVLAFGVPLLAGLVAGHAMVPPTPGPLAVAQLLGADIGWTILFGLIAGTAAVLVGGVLFAAVGERMGLFRGAGVLPDPADETDAPVFPVGAPAALLVLMTPLLMILAGTVSAAAVPEGAWRDALGFIGHPFTALLTACALAWAVFSRKVEHEALRTAMGRSLEPAGVIILVTGAGGAFKQILVDTGAGEALAQTAAAMGLAPVVAGFVIAGLVRVAQGSATVAMITAAGLVAPIAMAAGLNPAQLALVTIAIASGASILSHVNDSGFWLVSRYFNLTEAQTLRSWTVVSTLVGLTGFAVACVLYAVI